MAIVAWIFAAILYLELKTASFEGDPEALSSWMSHYLKNEFVALFLFLGLTLTVSTVVLIVLLCKQAREAQGTSA